MAKKRFHNSDSSFSKTDPSEVIIKAYPKVGGYLPEDINDGISGIDEQMSQDNNKKLKHLKSE
jgi:hypothetical protein